MAVSRDVALGKLIELLAHLYDSRHRKGSRHRHQHNQYDCYSHDLPPDGQADHVQIPQRVSTSFAVAHSSDGANLSHVLSAKPTALGASWHHTRGKQWPVLPIIGYKPNAECWGSMATTPSAAR